MDSVLVTGVYQGLLYAMMSSGFVLIYRASGVFNFAHGATATLSAYVAYSVVDSGHSFWLGVALALLTGLITSTCLDFVIVRRLQGTDQLPVAIATLGVTLGLTGLILDHWGATVVPLRPPTSTEPLFHIFDVAFSWTDVLIIATILVTFAALGFLIQFTRFGLALRAVNEGPTTSALMGIPVRRVRTMGWGIAGVLAALAAMLITPTANLSPSGLTNYFIASFAVVVVGGLESIRGVVLGGVAFGLANSLFAYWVTPRLLNTFSLAVILVVLTFFPNGLFGKPTVHVSEPTLVRGRPQWINDIIANVNGLAERLGLAGLGGRLGPVLGVVVAVLLVCAPMGLSEANLLSLTLACATLLAVLGQHVVSGQTGLISIGQSGFMVIGSYGTTIVLLHTSMPAGIALLVALAASAVVAFFLAVVASRLSGIYLALVTVGFALSLPELVAYNNDLAGGATGTPSFGIGAIGLGSDQTTSFYWVLGIDAVALAAVILMARSAHGRAWRAVRDSELAAASVGISVLSAKVEANVIGAVLAAVGGVLSSSLTGYLAPSSFTFWTANYILAALVIGGVRSSFGAIVGALIVFALPSMFAEYANTFQIIFGFAIAVILIVRPDGLGSLFARRQRSRTKPPQT